MRRAWIRLAILGTALAACRPELREGHYACVGDLDCPAEWNCRADRLCWSTPSDVRSDSGVFDAAVIDLGLIRDGEPNDQANADRDPADAADLGAEDSGDDQDVAPIDGGSDSGCAANAGTSCPRMDYCDAVYDCDGICGGGRPLPTCQCGTPTCGGCAGGTCGDNSTCQDGVCVCTPSNSACACDGRTDVECQYCAADGNLHVCSTDSHACGVIVRSLFQCFSFGCDPVDDLCWCSIAEGDRCDITDGCDCGLELCLLPATIGCDGSCVPDVECSLVCYQGRCVL